MKHFLFFLTLASSLIQAQVIISEDSNYNTSANVTPKAILDIQAVNSGVMMPKVDLLILSPTDITQYPPEGSLVYNIQLGTNVNPKGIYIFKDGTWGMLLNSDVVTDAIAYTRRYSSSTFTGDLNTDRNVSMNYSQSPLAGFFPTQAQANANTDGQFAAGFSGLGSWTRVTNFQTPAFDISTKYNLKNKVYVNGNGLVRFNNYASTNNIVYAVALFRQKTGDTNPILVGTKIFNAIISGNCNFDTYSTDFYEENIPSGNYTYFLAYKYLYTDNVTGDNNTTQASNGKTMAIGNYPLIFYFGAGNNPPTFSCNNSSTFIAQNTITLSVNYTP